MKCGELKELTGKMVKEWYAWLRKQDMGCCSVWFASTDKYRYCVCMGWHHYDDEMVLDGHGNPVTTKLGVKYRPVWKVAWKIGRQTYNNIMQCDLDVDFEMPYVTEAMAKADPKLCEGDVDDTLEVVECEKIVQKPFNYCGKTWHPWRWSVPEGYRDWNALATHMRKTARRVFKDWKDNDE